MQAIGLRLRSQELRCTNSSRLFHTATAARHSASSREYVVQSPHGMPCRHHAGKPQHGRLFPSPALGGPDFVLSWQSVTALGVWTANQEADLIEFVAFVTEAKQPDYECKLSLT